MRRFFLRARGYRDGVPRGFHPLRARYLMLVSQVSVYTSRDCGGFDPANGKSSFTLALPRNTPPPGKSYQFGWGCMQDNILHGQWQSISYVCTDQIPWGTRRRSLKHRQSEGPAYLADEIVGRRSLKSRQSDMPVMAAGQLSARALADQPVLK
jgi:hypothetical protein